MQESVSEKTWHKTKRPSGEEGKTKEAGEQMMTLYYHDEKKGSFREIPEAWEFRWFCERLLYVVAGIFVGYIWRVMQG